MRPFANVSLSATPVRPSNHLLVGQTGKTECNGRGGVEIGLADFEDELRRLPVWDQSEEIWDLVSACDVAFIQGDTGCGKSTGIPHILLRNEAAAGNVNTKILVTQPRRVAAISVANYVASVVRRDPQLRASHISTSQIVRQDVVGYRVRFEDRRTKDTNIVFATDGLLIRECTLAADVVAQIGRYDYIVIDEAHERSLRIDQLLGILFLSLASLKRRGFRTKIIVMSATLDAQTLTSFFRRNESLTIGELTVPGKMFPVALKYMNESCEDIVQAASAVVFEILSTSSTGDILVFLPGMEDILSLEVAVSKVLKAAETYRKNLSTYSRLLCDQRRTEILEDLEFCKTDEEKTDLLNNLYAADLSVDSFKSLFSLVSTRNLKYISDAGVGRRSGKGGRGAIGGDIGGDKGGDNVEEGEGWGEGPFPILPLHAALTLEEQSRVLAPKTTASERKIILSTNIAETSITLPDVRYVVDSGRVKIKIGHCLTVVDESKAMAIQRSGRAGRVAAGTAYRLMTPAAFEKLQPHIEPEILRTDLPSLVLDLKLMQFSQNQSQNQRQKQKQDQDQGQIQSQQRDRIEGKEGGQEKKGEEELVKGLKVEEVPVSKKKRRRIEAQQRTIEQAAAMWEISAHIGDLEKFPLPSSPPLSKIVGAKQFLWQLRAIQWAETSAGDLLGDCKVGGNEGKQFDLSVRGQMLAHLPVPPLWGALILESLMGNYAGNCAAEALTMAAIFSMEAVWFSNSHSQSSSSSQSAQSTTRFRERILDRESDHFGLVGLYNAWLKASDKKAFCEMLKVDPRNLHQAQLVRSQLQETLCTNHLFQKHLAIQKLGPPSGDSALAASARALKEETKEALRRCMLAAWPMNVATRRAAVAASTSVQSGPSSKTSPAASAKAKEGKEGKLGAIAGLSATLAESRGCYINKLSKEKLFLHPSSSLMQGSRLTLPDAIIYSARQQTTQNYVKDVTAIDAAWVIGGTNAQ